MTKINTTATKIGKINKKKKIDRRGEIIDLVKEIGERSDRMTFKARWIL